MKKKVGVVGYGGMGQWHVCSIADTTYLNAIDFEKSDVCEVAGIYDIDPAKNEKARNDGYRVFDTLEELLADKEIEIIVTAGDGPYSATAWGCDLTYDYVKINGDYRT